MPGFSNHKQVTGHEAFHWPETQALLKRLGFDFDSPTTCVTLTFPVDGMCRVVHEFNGLDANQSRRSVAVDSTSMQNKVYRTHEPNRTS